MKRLYITGREMAILSPGEVWGVPDGIAAQLVARGKGREEAEVEADEVEVKAELIQPDILKQEAEVEADEVEVKAEEVKPEFLGREKKVKKAE